MQVVLIILSLGLLGVIIYFVVSPKSSRLIKLAAIIALGFICLAIGICAFLLIRGPSQDPSVIDLPVFQDTPTVPAKKGNVSAIIIFIIVFLAIAVLMFVSIRRDKQEGSKPEKIADEGPVLNNNDDLNMELYDESSGNDSDDSFDIEF